MVLLSNLAALPASAHPAFAPRLLRPFVIPPTGSAISPAVSAGPALAAPTAPTAVTKVTVPAVCLAIALVHCSGNPPVAARPVVPVATGPSSWLNLTPSPYPATYPDARSAAMMTYDPDTESSLMFGGVGDTLAVNNDTWSVTAGNWTPVVSTAQCASVTCPTGRFLAGFAYDQPDHEAVLFGGLTIGTSGYVQYGDTWVLSGGTWTNITASAGPAPWPRFGVAMTYASSEGYVVLFGGVSLNDTYYSDTWTFLHGKWTNITKTEIQTPDARADASIADSPTGYTLMFGGGNSLGYIENTGGCPHIMWWFSAGQWTPAQTYTCIGLPLGAHGDTNSSSGGEPCGRDSPVLAWSPANQHFMLSGGETATGSGCPATGTNIALNDTYEYLAAPGAGFNDWVQDLSPNGPSDRLQTSFASDYRDGYVVVFGGALGGEYVTNETWRYYAVVQASLKGPLVLASSTTTYTFPLFTLTAFGGSGFLNYEFNVTSLKTGNSLTGSPDCGNFTDHATRSVPSLTGVVITRCAPDPGAYNVYRLSVSVWDSQQPTAHAYANWTFTAQPPEALAIHSKFTGTFYTGVSFTNTFSIYAQIDNAPVSQLTGKLGNFTSFTFTHDNNTNFWWNTTYNMGNAPTTGAKFIVTASTSNWNENATLSLTVVQTPSFLLTFIDFPGVVQTTTTSGAGPFNETYGLSQSVSVSLSKLFNITLPTTVPLINGIYNLLPSIKVSVSESSSAKVTLSGTLTETPPAISFGAFSLTISASLQLTGALSVTAKNGVETIDWVSASMTVTIKGDFKGNFPIWGYTFDILGNPVTIGFSLSVDLAPAVALQIVMVPADMAADSIADGMNFMVTQLIGSLSLPLTVSINFGIGVASVSAGGTLAVAVNFAIEPPPFAWSNIWVNGTVVLNLQILFWSTSWNLAGPANIYHGVPSIPERPALAGPASSYDNGSGAVWAVDARAYNTSGYDRLVWNPANTSGPAITDIYPQASPSAASAYGGAYLFYTNDRVDLPVQDGLTVAGLTVDSQSNAAVGLPAPSDPGYLVSAPRASTMPDGSVFVAWDALPMAQAVGTSPAGVTELLLHGARYSPASGTWGPIQQFTTTGFAQSYALDTSSATPIVTALVSTGIVETPGASAQLITYNLETGARLSEVDTTTAATVGSILSAPSGNSPGEAFVADFGGNWSEVGLGSGAPSFDSYAAPTNSTLVEEKFVHGSSAPAVLLRYRLPTSELVVLYNPVAETAYGSKTVGEDVADADALAANGGFEVYMANGSGFSGFDLAATGGTTPLPSVTAAGAESVGLAQVGGSILVYAMVPAGNGPSAGRTLFLAEIGLGLPPPTAGAPAPATSGTQPPIGATSFNALPYLGIPVAVAAAVIILLAVWPRRRPPTPVSPAAPDHVTAPPPPPPPPG